MDLSEFFQYHGVNTLHIDAFDEREPSITSMNELSDVTDINLWDLYIDWSKLKVVYMNYLLTEDGLYFLPTLDWFDEMEQVATSKFKNRALGCDTLIIGDEFKDLNQTNPTMEWMIRSSFTHIKVISTGTEFLAWLRLNAGHLQRFVKKTLQHCTQFHLHSVLFPTADLKTVDEPKMSNNTSAGDKTEQKSCEELVLCLQLLLPALRETCSRLHLLTAHVKGLPWTDLRTRNNVRFALSYVMNLEACVNELNKLKHQRPCGDFGEMELLLDEMSNFN